MSFLTRTWMLFPSFSVVNVIIAAIVRSHRSFFPVAFYLYIAYVFVCLFLFSLSFYMRAAHTHTPVTATRVTRTLQQKQLLRLPLKKNERDWTKPNKHRDKLHKAGLIYLMFCILESSFIADGGFVDANAFHHIYHSQIGI